METNPNLPLVDISTMKIDPALPGTDRLRIFAESVGDPCRFRVGETPVTVVYSDGAPSLQRVLVDFCQTLQ